ncbi:MAG: hypothetical protein HKN41_05400 [Ilumatobacter sp.]|nr:hypothetical protein [Ilumatobacter sp.]
MNDTAPLPPPAPDADPMGPPIRFGPRGRLDHPVALFATAVGIASAVSVVLGTLVGWFVMASSEASCSPSDGWCELGAALMGIFLGLTVAAIAYTVAGVVVIRRSRPKGERAPQIAAHIAFPPAVIIVLTVLSALAESV